MVAEELHKAKRHIGVVKSATTHVQLVGVLYLDMLEVALDTMAGVLVTRMVLLRTGNLRFRVALIAAPPPSNKVGNRGKRTGRLIVLAFVPCQPVICAMKLENGQRQLGTLAKVIIEIVVVLPSDKCYGGEHATQLGRAGDAVHEACANIVAHAKDTVLVDAVLILYVFKELYNELPIFDGLVDILRALKVIL